MNSSEPARRGSLLLALRHSTAQALTGLVALGLIVALGWLHFEHTSVEHAMARELETLRIARFDLAHGYMLATRNNIEDDALQRAAGMARMRQAVAALQAGQLGLQFPGTQAAQESAPLRAAAQEFAGTLARWPVTAPPSPAEEVERRAMLFALDQHAARFEGALQRAVGTRVDSLEHRFLLAAFGAGALLAVLTAWLSIASFARQRAESIAQAQRAHFDFAMSTLAFGSWRYDVPTGKMHWSSAMASLAGRVPSAMDLQVADAAASLHPDDRAPWLAAVSEAVAADHLLSTEVRRAGDGEQWRYFLSLGRPMATGAGVQMFGIDVDISSFKQVQKELATSEALFTAAFESAGASLALTTPDGQCLRVNQAFRMLLGLELEAPVTSSLAEFVYPPDQRDLRAALERLANGSTSSTRRELRVISPDGALRWVDITLAMVSVNNSAERYVAVQMIDLDQRKQAEAKLEAAITALTVASQENVRLLARLNEAQSIARIGSWVWTVDAHELWWSDELYRLCGLTPNAPSIRLEDYLSFVHEDDRKAYEAAMERAIANRSNLEFDLRIVTHQGDLLYCRSRGQWEFGDSGALERMHGTLQDLTERHALEEQLREKQKMESLGTLAGGVAHDFNNLLSIIIGNLQLLRHDIPPADAAQHARLEHMASATARARGLVAQILAFSRRAPVEFSSQDLAAIVTEAVGLLRSTVPSGIAIEYAVPGELPAMIGNATQLEQVLVNLCTNAWHACENLRDRKPQIRIELTSAKLDDEAVMRLSQSVAPGDYLCLRVTDNGDGMEPATLGRIFEPFFTTRGLGTGTGLGLAMVHGIVVSHRGAIEVRSEPGKGSCFEVYLPALASSAATEQNPLVDADAIASAALPHLRVLYVDDEPAIAAFVGELLGEAGMDVVTLTSASAALALIERGEIRDFDVLVCDYNMPEYSGLDLAKRAREVAPALPIILSSGFLAAQMQEQAASLGDVRVLNKVDLPEKLIPTLSQIQR